MTGKGIPHRYSIKRSNTLRERNIDEVALYFKDLQTYAAAQPYLNPTLSVKALNPETKAANSQKPPASPQRNAAPVDEERKPRLHFDPKAKRKPGQVLKLHTSYDEMMSKEGGTFGWVDKPKLPTEDERKKAFAEYADQVSKRPTIVLRQYETDENGTVGPNVINEIRFKELGPTLGQMQPGRTIGNAASAALGVVFDADGKMRCPPGTPNANQFTDKDMSNCFMFTPVTVARGILRATRKLAEKLSGSRGAISRIDRRFDTAYDADAFRRVEQAKRVYTTAERMAEKWKGRTDTIADVLQVHGITLDGSVGSSNIDLVHALAEQLGGLDKVQDIYSDVPGFQLLNPDGEVLTNEMWNAMSSAEKAATLASNAARYDEAVNDQIRTFLPDSVKKAISSGDPAAIDAANKFIERTRQRHHDAQRGMLGSLVQYRDEMEKSGVTDTFDKIIPWDHSKSIHSEAETLPDIGDDGLPKTQMRFAPMNIALHAEIGELAGKRGVYLDIASDAPLSDAQKQQEILRAMREITEAQEFVDLIGFANEQSAARGVADLGLTAEEMKGAHIMWHELGHVQQYNVARNKIMAFHDKNGFFPVVINGQLVKIETPPSAWTNEVWADAMNSVMGAGGRGMYGDISKAGFPPFGTDVFEESMLHLVSGERYQREIGGGLYVLGLPEEDVHRQLALMEGTTELFALQKMGVIEGPEVSQFTDWMNPVEPTKISGNIPPGEPPTIPDVPGPNVPEIPTAPPVQPSPPAGTTVINNNTVINVVINGPINIHVGGTAPDWDGEAVDPPTPPRTTVDLKWEDITPMILADRDSQWTATPSSGASIGQNKDLQKLWIDSAFGLGPDEGGYVPEQGELPRIDKDAYWKLSPEQIDTRYEVLRGEVDRLLVKSETEPLTKDEQAKLWLGIKGLQQILDVNAKKAALSDEKRDEYVRDGFDPTPGKYLRQVDSALKPQQKGFRNLAKKRATERGYEVVEVDDDELSHWSREIAAHAGTDNDGGVDGFSASSTPYKRGEVRNNPNFTTKKNLERNPNYDPSSEPSTPDTDAAGYVGTKLDEIKSRSTPQQAALLDSDEPIEKRDSVDKLIGSADPEEIKGMLSKSAQKRQSAKMGEDINRPTPTSSGDVLDEEFDNGAIHLVDLMDSSTLDDDVRIITSMDIPKNGISDGDTLDHGKILRGKVADFDTAENIDLIQPTSSRRVVVDVPKGSRGLPSKNSHDGKTEDFLIPPGSLSVVRVDGDGTIFATPLKQHSKKDVLDDMEKNLMSVDLEIGSLEELERRALLSSISREKSNIVPSKRTTRGMSLDGPVRARQSARNQAIVDGFSRYASPTNPSGQIGMTFGDNYESSMPKIDELPKRAQRVESSIAKIGGLLAGKAEPANQEEFDFIDSLSPEVKEIFSSLDAMEIQKLVDDELFDFHQQFDDRVRIPLHPEEFKEFLKTGKLPNIAETKPNSASAAMLRDFEGGMGMSPNLPDGARSHSGYMVHQSVTSEINDYLNELPGAGVTRNAHFFSETDDVNPSGYTRTGGKTIDLVLAPEVAQRSVYGRGDIMSGDVLPTPVLSKDRAEVGSAFIHMPENQANELDGMKQIAEVLEASVVGRKSGLGGGYGVASSVKSRNPGVAHEALVTGGITIADAEQVRIPVEALDMQDVSVSFDDVDLTNVRQKLGDAGLSDSDIDAVIERIGNGVAPYVVPEIERLRQGMAAEKMSQELELVPNHSMILVPTNPDGIDVLNPEPLPGEPVSNREAWMKRYAMDSSIDSIVKLAQKEKREKGIIEPPQTRTVLSADEVSRGTERARNIKYSEDGFKSIYDKSSADFHSEAVDLVEYNPRTRELRVVFAGQSDPYHFLDVDPDELDDFGDEFEPIGNKIDRIKRTDNRAVRGPDGNVVRWDGKEWQYEDDGLSSKKSNLPFADDIADPTQDDIDFDKDLEAMKLPNVPDYTSREANPDIFMGSGADRAGRGGMQSRRDAKLAAEKQPRSFKLGKKSKIKEGVESDEERGRRILELSKGDPRTLPTVRKANYTTYDGKDVYTADNIDDALALLLAGHHVDLSDTHDEEDLWKEFRSFKKWLKGVDKAAAKKMSFNLCSMHKEGANILCGKHKGIIRDDMPQVGGTVTDPNAPAIRLWVGGQIHGNSFDSYNGADAPDWVKQGLKADPNSPEFAKAKDAYDALENRYRALGSRYYPGNDIDPLTEAERQEFFALTDIRKVEPDMIDNFVDVLRANGIHVSEPEDRDPMTLRATQNELVAGTVLGLSDAITSYEDMLRLGQRPDGTPFTQQDYDRVRLLGPILITKDGYILDGHHRVFGKVAANFDREDDDQLMQRVRVVDMPLEALLAFTRAYQEHIGIASASGQSTERKTLPEEIRTPLDIIPMNMDDLTSLNGDFTNNLDTKVAELEERDGHPFFKPESPGFERGRSYRESMRFVERRKMTDRKPGERSSPSRVSGMQSRRSTITTPGARESIGTNRVGMTSSVQPNERKLHERAVDKAINDLDGVNLHDLSDAQIESQFGLARRGESSLIDGKPIYHTTDTSLALALLSHGYNVEVPNDGAASEVADSQDALNKEVKRVARSAAELNGLSKEEIGKAVKEAEDKFAIDMCKLYVAGKNMMCEENIGIDREMMPQLSGRAHGDDTLAMRAAKSGHVRVKEWVPKDKDNLPKEVKARFKELEAKHAAPGKPESFAPGEKEEFYSLVDWNDTEVDLIPEFEQSLAETVKAFDENGNPVDAIKVKVTKPEEYKASQRQLLGHKVDGMRDGIRSGLDKFNEHAESLGLKRGSSEYLELRKKWLAGEYKFADADGNKVKAWWMEPLLSTRDGYVLDGHHRWAAIKLLNEELPEDEHLDITWHEVQANVVEALTLGKAFQDKWGIKEAKLTGEKPFVKNDAVPGISPEEIANEMSTYREELPDRLAELHANKQFIRMDSIGAQKNPAVAEAKRTAANRGAEWAASRRGVQGGKVRVSREELEKVRSRSGMSSGNVRVRPGQGGVPEKVSPGQPDVAPITTAPKIARSHKGIDIPEFVDEMPKPGQYDDDVVEKAIELHEKVKKVEPELTDGLIDMAQEHGGQMEGLEFRFKATKGNAKKINNIARDKNISVEEAQSQVPDAVRYTMTFGEDDYVDGVNNALDKLTSMGHEVQVKNYWDDGDGYQGINVVVKHPDGFLYELQFHTPESFKVKQAAHEAYDEYQAQKDDAIRLELFKRMAAAAAKLPMPKGRVRDIGTLTRKNFQTWAQQQGGR